MLVRIYIVASEYAEQGYIIDAKIPDRDYLEGDPTAKCIAEVDVPDPTPADLVEIAGNKITELEDKIAKATATAQSKLDDYKAIFLQLTQQ